MSSVAPKTTDSEADAPVIREPVRPLAAFAVTNYRRFTIGQTISLLGSRLRGRLTLHTLAMEAELAFQAHRSTTPGQAR
jgi:hypothetical protein